MRLVFAYDWIERCEAFDAAVRRRILTKLKELERVDGWPHEPLKGRQFEGLYKLRVGDYRLFYRLADETLDFLTLGHRSEIYR